MAIYNLEETPDVYITPNYYENEFVYRMEHITAEESRTTIRSIDLRKDKLMIHGTEVNQSMCKRLYESLVLNPKNGIIYINCNGSCYVLVAAKTYRPINNVIFDWSSFGVIVPNSITDSLKKQLEEREKAVGNLNKQYELARIEVESTKASWKASNDEVNELKMVQNEMSLKMQKVCEKVALIDFELQLYKIELESCKKELDEVLDELCNCKAEKRKSEVELQNMHDRLSCEISSYSDRNREWETNTKMLEGELSLIRSELKLSKDQEELLEKNVKDLEERISNCENRSRDMKEEQDKVEEQFYKANKEVQNNITLLESSRKEIEELKEQIECYGKEQQAMELELQRLIWHVRSINLEVKSSNQKLDQVLISRLWNGLNHHSHQKLQFSCIRCGHTGFPPTLEIVAHEIPIH